MQPEPPKPTDAPPPQPPLGPFQFTLRSLMIAGTVLAVCCSAIKTLYLEPAYLSVAAIFSFAVLICRSWRDAVSIGVLALLVVATSISYFGWEYFPKYSLRMLVPSPWFAVVTPANIVDGGRGPSVPYAWIVLLDERSVGGRIHGICFPLMLTAILLSGVALHLILRLRANCVGSHWARGTIAGILAACGGTVYAVVLGQFDSRFGFVMGMAIAFAALAVMAWRGRNCRATVGACLLALALFFWVQQLFRWSVGVQWFDPGGPMHVWRPRPVYEKPIASAEDVFYPLVSAAALVLVFGALMAVRRRRRQAAPYSP